MTSQGILVNILLLVCRAALASKRRKHNKLGGGKAKWLACFVATQEPKTPSSRQMEAKRILTDVIVRQKLD